VIHKMLDEDWYDLPEDTREAILEALTKESYNA
jgi:chlorite dismutase